MDVDRELNAANKHRDIAKQIQPNPAELGIYSGTQRFLEVPSKQDWQLCSISFLARCSLVSVFISVVFLNWK